MDIRIDFECPGCISSFETDIITVVGVSAKDEILFTVDVEVPPQVDPEFWLVSVIDMAAFVTICTMGGTIVIALLLDIILFQSF